MFTPLDIEKKEFKNSTFGFNKPEVTDFLQMVKNEYEKLYKDNIALKDKVNILTDAIGKYKTMEDSLREAILVAQEAADEVKRNAADKAAIVVREAQFQSNEIIVAANHKSAEIESEAQKKADMMVSEALQRCRDAAAEHEKLKMFVDSCKIRIKTLLQTQSDVLSDFMKYDSEENQRFDTQRQLEQNNALYVQVAANGSSVHDLNASGNGSNDEGTGSAQNASIQGETERELVSAG